MFNVILTAGYTTAYPLLDIFVKVNTNSHLRQCLDLLYVFKYTCMGLVY